VDPHWGHHLKIASIAPANNPLLVSTNLRDYLRVPNLRSENWLR
jgi:predicted nucleic acid-binding protein